MKLIDEIVDLLSSTDGSLTDALLKTKVLLHNLDQIDLIAWVNSELNGYGEQQELPNYRKVPAQVLANLSSMAFQANSHPLPIGHLDKNQRERLETADMRQSLAVLEKFALNPEGRLESPIPLEANAILGKNLASGVAIQRAWSQIETSSIVQILTEVRSRLLDFVLRIRDELPQKPSQADKRSVDTRSLFNNSILGDNAVIVIGDRNTTNIVNHHLEGNFDALVHELKKYNVPSEDIGELENAIKTDEPNINPELKEFGASVKAWLQRMLHKAVETSWQIELGIASAILTEALKHYYGWGR